MNDGLKASAVRQLAQSDPVPNLTRSLGEQVEAARKEIAALTRRLRDIDHCRGKLAEHKITVEVDLGPIGNAAAAARRDLERDTGQRTFQLPRKETP